MTTARRQLLYSVVGGLLTTPLLLWIIPTVPAIAIVGGMTSITVPMLAFQKERKQYAVAGTAFFLGLAVILSILDPIITANSQETIVSAAFLFGSISLLIIGIKEAGKKAARKTLGLLVGAQTAERLFESVSSVLAAASLFWTLTHLSKKATTHGGFGVGGSLTFLLSLVGIQQQISVPILKAEVDIILFVFVGCVLAGFYTFESINTTWMAVKQTASKSVETSRKVQSETSSVVAKRRQDESGNKQDK